MNFIKKNPAFLVLLGSAAIALFAFDQRMTALVFICFGIFTLK
jgi:hypothetical protein